jgi:hypothetical protein
MRSDMATPRRHLLIAAGVGMAAGVLDSTAALPQTPVPEPSAESGPATAVFNGRLYALWREVGGEAGLWYAAFDGAQWSAKARMERAASSASPALAVFGNRLYAVWKGRSDDPRLWSASFDGVAWSAHMQIPGAISGGAPSLSVFDRKLYAVWKTPGAVSDLAVATFDGTAWSSAVAAPPPPTTPIAPDTHPFTPQMIANSGQSGAGGVDQGKRGDCVFESSAAAVATTPRGQVAISKAIVQNPDASYTVTFPGAPQRPVRLTQSDIKSTGVRDSALWAEVLEAAIIISDPDFTNGGHLPPDATGAADGGRPTPAQYALHLLTGSPAARDLASAVRIGNRIAQALANGQPVVAFCANNDDGALVSGHEWTVIACDPQADKITLRNPWGNFRKAGTSQAGILYDGNAEVTMTLAQFGQFYKEVTFGYARG